MEHLRKSLISKVEELEAEEIIEALKKSNCVKAKAARLLGITERMIGYKIKKYGIRREVILYELNRVGEARGGSRDSSESRG